MTLSFLSSKTFAPHTLTRLREESDSRWVDMFDKTGASLRIPVLLLLFFGIASGSHSSAAGLQAGDIYPSFEMKETITAQDYAYLRLSKGSLYKGQDLIERDRR